VKVNGVEARSESEQRAKRRWRLTLVLHPSSTSSSRLWIVHFPNAATRHRHHFTRNIVPTCPSQTHTIQVRVPWPLRQRLSEATSTRPAYPPHRVSSYRRQQQTSIWPPSSICIPSLSPVRSQPSTMTRWSQGASWIGVTSVVVKHSKSCPSSTWVQ
jgi:hypothetical protein